MFPGDEWDSDYTYSDDSDPPSCNVVKDRQGDRGEEGGEWLVVGWG